MTAFLGGKCAEDVVNVLGGREQPIQNMLLFDGEACLAPVYALYPIVPTTAVEAKNGEVFRPTVVWGIKSRPGGAAQHGKAVFRRAKALEMESILVEL